MSACSCAATSSKAAPGPGAPACQATAAAAHGQRLVAHIKGGAGARAWGEGRAGCMGDDAAEVADGACHTTTLQKPAALFSCILESAAGSSSAPHCSLSAPPTPAVHRTHGHPAGTRTCSRARVRLRCSLLTGLREVPDAQGKMSGFSSLAVLGSGDGTSSGSLRMWGRLWKRTAPGGVASQSPDMLVTNTQAHSRTPPGSDERLSLLLHHYCLSDRQQHGARKRGLPLGKAGLRAGGYIGVLGGSSCCIYLQD